MAFLSITVVFCFVALMLLVCVFCHFWDRTLLLTDMDSGVRTNDGRVLERYEWRGMDVKTKAWYES